MQLLHSGIGLNGWTMDEVSLNGEELRSITSAPEEADTLTIYAADSPRRSRAWVVHGLIYRYQLTMTFGPGCYRSSPARASVA